MEECGEDEECGGGDAGTGMRGQTGELHPSRETRKLGTVSLPERIVTGEWGVGRGGG